VNIKQDGENLGRGWFPHQPLAATTICDATSTLLRLVLSGNINCIWNHVVLAIIESATCFTKRLCNQIEGK